MPIHLLRRLLHAMSGTELSHVRTEFDQLRIVPTVPPHPVQANSEFSGHRRRGNVFVSRHYQVHIPTPPVRVTPRGCLCCFSQQVAQQRIALLADVSQPLFAGAGVRARNESGVAADLLAARKPLWRPDDENVGHPRDGPTPGCVINSTTSGRLLASCSTAVVNSAIFGSSWSSSSNSSFRRRLAQGANTSFSNFARPCSLNIFFLQR
jgi:hypothetical protein